MQAILKSRTTVALRPKGILKDGNNYRRWKPVQHNLLPDPLLSVRLATPVRCLAGQSWENRHLHRPQSQNSALPGLYLNRNNEFLILSSRDFSTGVVLYSEPLKPSSKVEETVNAIKGAKESPSAVVKEKPKKPPLHIRVWNELVHYYHGFRLLFIDINISRRLLWRVLNGKSLSRREHRLLVRTVGDMFRLVPFSVFIIVPFMEFLLPLAIKLFPGMLPSTFQTATERDDKMKQHLKVRLEMAKFLQTTLDEMSVQSQGNSKSPLAKEFSEFFKKVRTSGESPTTADIIKFSKLFEDEITLDSLSRQQLTALCRVLDINPMGTMNLLRFQIRMKLRSLAADDKMIKKEGIDSLTIQELQSACQARGMRAYGVSEEKLKSQLSQWLDLSLNEKVPPSLLLLSRAFMLPETTATPDQLKATISALPDTVELKAQAALDAREGIIDNKAKIELLKEEVKMIREERKEEFEAKKLAEAEKLVDKAPVLDAEKTPQLEPVLKPAEKMAEKKAEEITTKDIEVLEDALDTLGKQKKKLLVEKEELDELKEELQEYEEDVKELKQVLKTTDREADIKETKAAKNLFKKVNSMISKMDVVLSNLEKKGESVKGELEEKEGSEQIVRIDELMETVRRMQKIPDEERLEKIAEVLSKIDDDRDGAISVDEVLKVVELIGKEHVQLTTKQLDEIIELLEKEEALELEDQIEKALEKHVPADKAKGKSVGSIPSVAEEKKARVQVQGEGKVPPPKLAISTNGQKPPTTIDDPKSKNNNTSKQL